ncbi:POL5 [Hepatospora eriocheir]|uniref:POL5 n=1 Tax=Hepatospora eriocheir TaxID=1081669 RepID=A0A1X0QHF6_9MICR|nr:POL5 [Hepatospora eriocheir]
MVHKEHFILNKNTKRYIKDSLAEGHDILLTNSNCPLSQSEKSSYITHTRLTTKCLSISNTNQQTIKFRGNITGFEDYEQPTFEIFKLTELSPIKVITWIDTFKNLQTNCGWSDTKATNIMSTLMSPEIYKIVSHKKTSNTMIEVLKENVFPKNHYMLYKEKTDSIMIKDFKSIKEYYTKISELITYTNMCLDKKDHIEYREKFDIFYKGLLPFQKRAIRVQNSYNIEEAIQIIEGLTINDSQKIQSQNLTQDSKSIQKTANIPNKKNSLGKKFCNYHKWGRHNTEECTKYNNYKTNNNNQTYTIKELPTDLRKISFNAFMNNIDTTFTVDTGSYENILSLNEAKNKGLKIYKLKEQVTLQVANKNTIVLTMGASGSIILPTDSDISFDVDFFIADNFVDEIILGLKFLEKFKGNILIKHRMIVLDNYRIPMLTPISSLSKPDALIAEKTKCLLVNDNISNMIDNFVSKSPKLGLIPNIEHSIKLNENVQIKSKPYPIPLKLLDRFKIKINQLLKEKIIRKSNSSILSPCFVIEKQDGDLRLVVDYRKLNNATERIPYPIPNLNQQVNSLLGCKIFSTIDLNSGYY